MKVVALSVIMAALASSVQGQDLFGGLFNMDAFNLDAIQKLLGGDLLQKFTDALFSGQNPLGPLSSVFETQAVDKFANRALGARKSLLPAADNLQDVESKLKQLQTLVNNAEPADQIVNELEILDLDKMVRDVDNSERRVESASSRMSKLGGGMRSLSDAMENPESTQQGMLQVLDVFNGNVPGDTQDTRQGVNNLKNILSGLGKKQNKIGLASILKGR